MALKKKGKIFARGNEPILVLGESGTGKELVAQALHSASSRADKPFVTVNCAALPHDLMEAELFGYEGGAFTGAKSSGIKGKNLNWPIREPFFLDEIGELPLEYAGKASTRFGKRRNPKIGPSGTAAFGFQADRCNQQRSKGKRRKGFLPEDLYHRLNILELTIPPLRDRVGDIPLLARHFIELHAGAKRGREIQISNELYRAFGLYPWHGNIRELKNVITYALFNLEEDEKVLSTRHLPERFFRELLTEQPEIKEKGTVSRQPESGRSRSSGRA